jgi:hypothetical protein
MAEEAREEKGEGFKVGQQLAKADTFMDHQALVSQSSKGKR